LLEDLAGWRWPHLSPQGAKQLVALLAAAMAGLDRRLQPIRQSPAAEELAGDHLSLPQMEAMAGQAAFMEAAAVGEEQDLML
jgi:hypothetical protein